MITIPCRMLTLPLLTACCSAQALAGGIAPAGIIDFETNPVTGARFQERDPVSNQYAQAFGVTFSIEGSATRLPIIASSATSSASVAFGVDRRGCTSASGTSQDSPLMEGIDGDKRALTDPIINGDQFASSNIVIHFNPPVRRVQMFITDIDSGEVFDLRGYHGAGLVASQTRSSGDPDTGDGLPSTFVLCAEAIDRVVIDVDSDDVPTRSGFAVDAIAFSRLSSAAADFVEVAQESSPGAGDFDANVLGLVRVLDARLATVAQIYSYDNPVPSSYGGTVVAPTGNRSQIGFARAVDGLALFMVHDRSACSGANNSGTAVTRVDVLGSSTLPGRAVQDGEDPDVFSPAVPVAGGTTFAASNVWDFCCTDGQAIGGLNGNWVAYAQFTQPPSGLDSWAAGSHDGVQIALGLVPGLRARFRPVPLCLDTCSPTLVRACTGRVTDIPVGVMQGAGAGPVQVRWTRDGAPFSPTARVRSVLSVDGSTSTLRFDPVLLADTGRYAAIVQGPCGSIATPAVELRVLPDLNGDGVVNTPDLAFFIGRFGQAVSPGTAAAEVDFNRDGMVSTPDLVAFIAMYGGACH